MTTPLAWNPEGPDQPLRVMVVDDVEANALLLAAFLSRKGHKPLVVNGGAAAVETFRRESPDLVLMDVMMPDMDGYEATRRIRAIAGERWVPVIFLSAMTSEEDLVRGIKAGGDDYLNKPVSLVVLDAKMRSMQRIAAMQAVLAAKEAHLARLHSQARSERQLAATVLDRLVRHDVLARFPLRWQVDPTEEFSGDLVAAAEAPDGRRYLMLADATGHGLPAAITVMSVLQTFYGTADKGLPIATVVAEMNQRLMSTMPVGRYVAALVAELDPSTHRLKVWNGGMPTALILRPDGERLAEIRSDHLPLGIVGDGSFDAATREWAWDGPCALYACSDGLVEAENAAGDPYGVERYETLLAATPAGQRFDAVLADLGGHLNGAAAIDDVSLLELSCG